MKVNLNIPKDFDRTTGVLKPSGATKHGMNSCKQLMRIKWLWKVIVRTAVEAKNAVISMHSSCQHDHRDCLAATQLLEHSEAVNNRQHYVKDNQVVCTLKRTRQPIASVV